MSSKLVVIKDIINRNSLKMYKIQKRSKKVIHNDYYINNLKLFYNSDFNVINRIKNRCVLTTRSKAVFSYYRLTRMAFKLLGSNGLLPGIRKSSW